ncbi:sodium- and chloride-dependent GABA transporter 2-like [Engraulis encrasicolus]|uniref:sodium- and chloride-dependent GABA transporter 2-like n=1 Tax=Engraulis encrasicolus TaxID=184585 RepID=UPI002FCE91A9
MIGYRPWPFMKSCWIQYITPTVCIGTFIFSLTRYSPLKFNKTYVYPWWAHGIGWFLAASSLCFIPLTMLYKLYHAKGTILQLSCPDLPCRNLPGDAASLPRPLAIGLGDPRHLGRVLTLPNTLGDPAAGDQWNH